MADIPWWYSVVHEWRQRAFLETHHWPPAITITVGASTTFPDHVPAVAMLTRTS